MRCSCNNLCTSSRTITTIVQNEMLNKCLFPPYIHAFVSLFNFSVNYIKLVTLFIDVCICFCGYVHMLEYLCIRMVPMCMETKK